MRQRGEVPCRASRAGEPFRSQHQDLAAALHFQVEGRAAGNGSLMRAATSAVYFARAGRTATMDAARRIAALTHGDRAAWEGTAVLHELVRVALDGDDPLTAVPDTLDCVHGDHRERWAAVLAPGRHPGAATEFNGAVWPCLGTALWALRTTRTFEDALSAAVDVGGDTDTVAAVTGALAGAVYGYAAIPARWTAPLHVPLPGFGNRVLHTAHLVTLAQRLDGRSPSTRSASPDAHTPRTTHKGHIRAEWQSRPLSLGRGGQVCRSEGDEPHVEPLARRP